MYLSCWLFHSICKLDQTKGVLLKRMVIGTSTEPFHKRVRGSLDKHVLHKGKQMVLRTIHCKVLWETKNGFPKLLFGSFLFKSVSLCQYVGW